MALEPGTRLGPYEILAQLGAGGMGEVYKGRDVRLERLVALKVLSPHLASNPEARERFEREATTIANLKHAHICVLYDIGKDGGRDYLVLEYLEGETLSQRLQKGPLPLEQVLQYVIEIADALDKAHRAGVTHRDIKPGNIMLVPTSGQGSKTETKLLDFGLAKLKKEILEATVPPSERPTVPGALTEHGTLLGTLQYMAPEQLESKEVDGRTDIFAFGAVVYEIVTGKKAFPGESQASVIAKILDHHPPPMSSLQPLTPPSLDRAVNTCLAKEPDERWQTARDLWRELKWIREGILTRRQEALAEASDPAKLPVPEALSAPAAPTVKVWRRMMPVGFAALVAVILAIAAGVGVWLLKPAAPQPVSRLTISLPPGQRLAALYQPAIAISPDGKNLAYVAIQTDQSRNREGAVVPVPPAGQPPLADARGSDAGTQQLYLRPLDSLESKPIAGTEGAMAPFFSPDGQWIGFFAAGRLKKVPVNGGAVVTLASVSTPGGASWGSQGTLALQGAVGASAGLQQISQDGGMPQPLTRVGGVNPNHGWPEFLPDGKAFLFAHSPIFAAWTNAQVAVQSAGGDELRSLTPGTHPRYAVTGHLLYAQSGTLMAAPFDARNLVLSGAGLPVLEGIVQADTTGAAQYSISSTGTLVYVAGGFAVSESRLVWVSRNGEEQLLPAGPHNYQFPQVSPDSRRVAVGIAEQEQQIWVYDISRDTLTRLTFAGNTNNVPTWSPDGRRVAFGSNQASGPLNLFWRAADGSGGEERLTTSDYLQAPASFSPDGQLVAIQDNKPETGRDIWVLSLTDKKAQPFLRTPYEDTAPKFSPDGKWIAYSSNESGRREIYVQPYPGPGGKWQISAEGGQEPVWNPRGGELFYRSGSKMMAVDVNPSRDREGAGASSLSAGRPRMLFEGPYMLTSASFPYYDVSPDGQRFLMLKPVESQSSAPTQINVVLNWFEELKRRVP